MKVKQLKSNLSNKISGPLLITPNVYCDSRGFFMESWNKNEFDELVNSKINFVQDNHSQSDFGVVRGLHYQIKPRAQGKLVRCLNGTIFDVAVDLRVNSLTYREWISVELSSESKQLLWIPEGFAHGFLTLSKKTDVLYKTTDYWASEFERSIRWDDPVIGISWPELEYEFRISEKDRKANFFSDISMEDLFC